MKIEKTENFYGTYDIRLVQDGKILDIIQTGDDIQLLCRNQNWDVISNTQFDITNENEEVYQKFNQLYENIIDGNVCNLDRKDSSTIRSMEMMKCSSWYEEFVKDGVITVLSDSYPVVCPNIVKIKRYDNMIQLYFEQVDGKEYGQLKYPFMIPVDIRQSGSRLYEFAYPFRTLLKELQSIKGEKEKIKVLK